MALNSINQIQASSALMIFFGRCFEEKNVRNVLLMALYKLFFNVFD
jgi:hypothetical protein